MSAPTKFVRVKPDTHHWLGETDGPMRFIPSLGMEVPTFVDPREDLKSKANAAGAHIAVDYHIPMGMRGSYKPEQLANYEEGMAYPLAKAGNVRCGGLKADGQICQKMAQHRTGFCTNHGGAIHPADKFFSANRAIAPTDLSLLTRVQKFQLEIIPLSELTDEEISKMAIRDDDGVFKKVDDKFRAKFRQMFMRELFNRADDYMSGNAMRMLEVVKEIADSDIHEARDRLDAAKWSIERVFGKTPDILLTNKSDKPFETLFADVVSGTREDYRQGNVPAIDMGNVIEGEIVIEDGTEEEDDNDDVDIYEEVNSQPVTINVEFSDATVAAPITESGSDRGDNDGDTDGDIDILDLDAARAAKAQQIKDAKDKITRARKRRFAARAQGLNSISNVAYGVKFIYEMQKDGSMQTRLKFVAPDDTKTPKTR
jgi:hypothetical protein